MRRGLISAHLVEMTNIEIIIAMFYDSRRNEPSSCYNILRTADSSGFGDGGIVIIIHWCRRPWHTTGTDPFVMHSKGDWWLWCAQLRHNIGQYVLASVPVVPVPGSKHRLERVGGMVLQQELHMILILISIISWIIIIIHAECATKSDRNNMDWE